MLATELVDDREKMTGLWRRRGGVWYKEREGWWRRGK